MPREVVSTDTAPAAIGPYSQAMKAGGMLYVSGAISMDPATGAIVEGGCRGGSPQAMANLQAICTAAGTDLTKAVRCTIYLTSLGDFAAVNGIYAEGFEMPFPVRACVEVSALPKGGVVEIDAVVEL